MRLILFLCLLFSSVAAFAAHHNESDIKSYGGWIGYTAISDDYLLDSTPSFGLFGTHSINHNVTVSGSVYYDTLYKKGRVGYAFGKYKTRLKDIPIEFSAGMLRSEWGFWGDSDINPTTAPLLLKGNSIYTDRQESDIINRPGISTKFKIDDFAFRLFVGSNYTIDKEAYTQYHLVQRDADINNTFGELKTFGMTWTPIVNHTFNLDWTHGNISKEIDLDRDILLLGYKYEMCEWTASIEFMRLWATGNVVLNGQDLIDDSTIINDGVFVYLARDFTDYRVYTSYTYGNFSDEMVDYVGSASYRNSALGLTGPSKNPEDVQNALQDNSNDIHSITLGISYDLDDDLVLRVEGAYAQAKGLQRLSNTQDGRVRDRNESYFGIGIFKTF